MLIGMGEQHQALPDNRGNSQRCRPRLRTIPKTIAIGLLTAAPITPTIMVAIVGLAVCPATKPMAPASPA
jgi:hypothetical protein